MPPIGGVPPSAETTGANGVQYAFQVFKDDSSLNYAGPLAALNTAPSILVGKRFRVRLGLYWDGGAANNYYVLEYRKTGAGAWNLVTAAGTDVRIVNSPNFANNAPIPTALFATPGGSTGFVPGVGVDAYGSTSLEAQNTQHTEVEWSLALNGNSLVTDYYEFRAVVVAANWNGTGGVPATVAFATYTNLGRINVQAAVGTPAPSGYERAEVFEGVQLGIETTPGVAVPATVRLLCTGFELDPKFNKKSFRPAGSKFSTTVISGKEHTESKINGTLAFLDALYLFAAGICVPVITTPVGANLTRRWTFIPNWNAPDTLQTYTCEKGSIAGAEQLPFLSVSQLQLMFDETQATCQGTAFGGLMKEPFTLTGGTRIIPALPIDPASVSVYMGNDMNSLVRLGRDFVAELQFGNRQKPFKTLDDSTPTISGAVEAVIDAKINLTLEHDNVGIGLLLNARQGLEQVVKIEALGAQIEPGFQYRMSVIAPIKFLEDPRGVKDDIVVSMPKSEIIYDPTIGSAIQIVIDCAQTSL